MPPAVPKNGLTWWSPDLRYACVYNHQTTQLEFYAVPNTQKSSTITLTADTSIAGLQISPHHKYVAINILGRLSIWDIQSAQQLFTLPSYPSATIDIIGSIDSLTWSPDGEQLAFSYVDEQFQAAFTIFNAHDGHILFQKSFPGQTSVSVFWSVDGTNFAIFLVNLHGPYGEASVQLSIWDSQTYQTLRSFETLHVTMKQSMPLNIHPAAWSPDDSQIAAFSGYYIWVWGMADAQSHVSPTGFTQVRGLAWSADKTCLCILAYRDFEVWNLIKNTRFVIPQDNTASTVVAFAWTSDSRSIIIADTQNRLSQWNMP